MNELNNDKKKKSVWLPFLLLLIGVLATTGIVAYFLDADKTENVMTVGKNTVEIVEEFDPPDEVIPDTSFTKDVKVKNVDGCDCFVRVKAVFENSHMEQYCEINWNDTDWVYDSEDGYWYYPETISEGESTPSLFTTIMIDADIPKLEITNFNIIVCAESVESLQAQGFTSYVQAWEHYQVNKSN